MVSLLSILVDPLRTCPGRPTDELGNDLPPETPAPPRYANDDNPWYPFDSEAQFRLADFAYRKDEMSTAKINKLLKIWALDKAKHDDLTPFTLYDHMYKTIDTIEQGDIPWQSFSMRYQADDDNPADTPWKQAKYEVWYQDPTHVVRNMLDNPDFNRQFNYTPYVELDKSGKRKWSNFMSGNFAWRHSVRRSISCYPSSTDIVWNQDPDLRGRSYLRRKYALPYHPGQR